MSKINLRRKPRVSYCEVEEPNLDEYVFCEECADFVYEYCSIHGPLLVIPDDKIPTQAIFPPVVPRAALTIPRIFLHIARSIIPGAGLGVFATLTLPSGVRFGPYRGHRTADVRSAYCWQIHDGDNKWSHAIDAADASCSNWMRYVNCSRHWQEQNLVAYQYQGQIYYRTIKIIPRYTELMVFYGGEFARRLGVNLKYYNRPPGYASKFGGTVVQRKNENQQKMMTETTGEPVAKKKHENGTQGKKLPVEETTGEAKKRKCNKDRQQQQPSKGKKSLAVVKNKKILPTSPSIQTKNTDTHKEVTIGPSHTESRASTILTNNINSKQSETVKTPFATSNEDQTVCVEPIKSTFPCDICDKNFETEVSVEKHIIEIHALKSEPAYSKIVSDNKKQIGKFQCHHCNKSYDSKNSLHCHIKLHTGENLFNCNHCSKCFSILGNLKIHLRIHTGEKPYKCNHCSKCFSQLGDLKRHLRIHTGEKPYKCNHCSKCFSILGNLKIHLRIHTGEKPYKCNHCSKGFSQLGDLKRHLRIHTGEKP